MKLQSAFEPPKELEEAAHRAEQRKRQAIAKLAEKLGSGSNFQRAMEELIDADKRSLQEKGR